MGKDDEINVNESNCSDETHDEAGKLLLSSYRIHRCPGDNE